MDSCDKALAVNPKNATAWGIRGVALARLERYDEAVNSFDKGLTIDPNDATAWKGRAGALLGLKRYYEAVNSFDKALSVDPNSAIAWNYRGVALLNLERYQESVDSCDKALAIGPNNATGWNIRGVALFALGRYLEAVESYEEALKHDSDLQSAYRAKIEALDKLEEWIKVRRPPNPYVELFKEVMATEERLHIFIRHRLEKVLGKGESEWWVKGVPQEVRKKCAQRREEDPRREDAYGYTDLIDLKEIIDDNWRFFNEDFQQVKGKFKDKKEFLAAFVRLNDIRKIVMHPVRSLPTGDDFGFARHMREVIEQFCGPG